MVALFRARKGLDVLLWAMAKLNRQGILVRLRAVGDFETEEYRQEILRLVDELGLSDQIEWRGFRSDVGEELRAVDALVLPSLFGEGLPMVVLEAMAAGLPIVASGVEGVPEAVRDGQEGLLVPPGNIDALADALARIASDPADTLAMGRAARNRQRARFSDRAMAEGIGRIYDRILDPVRSEARIRAPTA
jgi:glycosyltransferase involved in cell wall biosynthesis